MKPSILKTGQHDFFVKVGLWNGKDIWQPALRSLPNKLQTPNYKPE